MMEMLCARRAMLRPFHPLTRNICQQFYRWPTIAATAKNSLDMHYHLLGYIYTPFHKSCLDSSPLLS
ncbi:hypothetical protein BDQ17DRAFT_1505380 [Cyathus striatus]|nr:hypothetical protein BDQ17DRAFT_1505380 [Cyathus striatus]